MKSRRLVIVLCLITFLDVSYTQELVTFEKPSVGFQAYYVSFLTMAPKAAYLRDSYSYLAEVNYQKPIKNIAATTGFKRLPKWGIGAFFGNTGSRQYMGNTAGVFPFISLPLYKTQKFAGAFRFGAGLGWVQKPYNQYNNHKNTLIGSSVNGYIHFLLQNDWHLSPSFTLNAGLGFHHLSNGSTRLPNLGINIPAVSAGMRYHLNAAKKIMDTILQANHSFNKKLSYTIYASAGVKQAPWVESDYFVVNVFAAEASKMFSADNKYGGGVVLFYDRSLVLDPAGIPTVKRENNETQLGVYASYEHSFGRLSIPLQLGAYVFNRESSSLFQNIGFKYKATEKLSAALYLKAHMGQANLIHVGIGYKVR